MVFDAKDGKSKSPLRKRRAEHLKSRHADQHTVGNLATFMRESIQVVEASSQLPEDQRCWTCPWCYKGLPSLNKQGHNKSVAHRYRKHRPRRDTSLKAIHAARAKIQKERIKKGL